MLEIVSSILSSVTAVFAIRSSMIAARQLDPERMDYKKYKKVMRWNGIPILLCCAGRVGISLYLKDGNQFLPWIIGLLELYRFYQLEGMPDD